MTQRPVMVFHAPYPVGGDSPQASAVRPIRMRQAFEDIGFDVIDITGNARDRARAVRTLSKQLSEGLRVEFGYGENSTMPTVLTQPHHLPTHPLVDLNLLCLLRRHGIPTGLFYRDIYWRFDEYTDRVNPAIAVGTRSLYHAELLVYRHLLDRVYLPSMRIASYVPHLVREQTRALPPGGRARDATSSHAPSSSQTCLTVLYVGNISPYYRMHELVRAVNDTPGVRLVLCVPEPSWAAVTTEYVEWMGDRIEVVHRSGEGLNDLFAQADVCSLMVEPSAYRDFAAPIKLYEYLGYGKPVLASAGTLAAATAEKEGFGWAVAYDVQAISARLVDLRDDAPTVTAVTTEAEKVRHAHTWTARAAAVASDLASLDTRVL